MASNCPTCSALVSLTDGYRPTHFCCDAASELMGGPGVCSPEPDYTHTVAEVVTILATGLGAPIIVSWDSTGTDAKIDHCPYSFATAMACLDPFASRGGRYLAI